MWVPSGNRPVSRREQEYGWFAGSQQKICLTAVENGAGWCTRWHALVIWIGRGDGDAQRLFGACSVVRRAKTRSLVRNPPRTAGATRHAPRIDQLRIGDASDSGRVGNKID